jgi:aspartate aminotransferase
MLIQGMNMKLADRLSHIKPSATFAIAAKAQAMIKQGHPIINLGVGEPDTDTPLNIKAVGIQAIHDGYTRYTSVQGTNALRKAICNHMEKNYQLVYAPDQIIVSNGAKQSLSNALFALVSPGEEVLIPTPYWVSYPEMVHLAGGVPKFIPCDQSNRYLLTPELLERYITPKTKVLILNSPCNPSGMCYNASELSRLADVLINYPNVTVISDDIYAQIHWQEDGFHNIAMASEALINRTIVINGVSKAYSMTGWRIGFAAGPKEVIKGMTTIQSQLTSCASSIGQVAAIEAMETHVSREIVHAYKARHQLIYQALNQFKDIEVTPSDGSFYILPNMAKIIKKLKLKDDLELADMLLEKLHLSVIPGSAFGAPKHIRISFAIETAKLKEAIARLSTWFEKLG